MKFFPIGYFPRYFSMKACLGLACLALLAVPAYAQTAAPTPASVPVPGPTPAAPAPPSAPARFETSARAANSVTLMAGKTPIKLWGVESVGAMGAAFNLKARTALDNAIGQAKIICEVKTHDGEKAAAQCNNKDDHDLGLMMLQQGYVTVDRAGVFNTVFEDPYIQAETEAQSKNLGVWAADAAGPAAQGGGEGTMMVSFGFVLFICITAAFAVLSVVIMRGFQKVIEAQNKSVELMSQERRLRDKERGIVAVMLDSEIKANKAKIEAYRTVYEEMLRSLKDPEKTPKYKKAGDIIQKQPALSRSIFDRNADKLDMFGPRLSSELIHFYARVKSSPEYINLEPNTPLEEAIGMLEKVLKNAGRMNEISDKILESFNRSGISSENHDYGF